MYLSLRATDDDLARLIGNAIRTARVTARWTQAELARRLGVTQSAVSRLETGASSSLDVGLASAAFRLMGIRVSVDAATPGLVRRREQNDFVHARCVVYAARHLQNDGWDTRLEIEVGRDRYRGWIDLLAYRAADRSLFCAELKTELDDVGRIQRTLAWYGRSAGDAARRLGWRPRSIATGLLVLASAENDLRISRNVELFAREFPTRSRELATWFATSGMSTPRTSLAMIDPRSRRAAWLRSTTVDGRRSPAAYADYGAAAEALKRR
ncbi:MAG: helix-turn-helix transcriptional regulator [Chloroflexi bacterium]|nr:helix-turn-helix transcriptional regulator [Chloroflexota bacterium]